MQDPSSKTGAAALKGKRRRFVEEYLVDFNATAAYKRAGYKPKNDDVAATCAARLLGNAQVAAAVEASQHRLAGKLEITQERVLREYARIAFSDPRLVAKWGPSGVSLLPSEELTDDAAACVAEVSETTSPTGGSLKFKLHDKKGALDSLAKHLGLFPKDDEGKSENAATILARIVERSMGATK